MNESESRQQLLQLLNELSAEFPSMRFGQLLCNLATFAGKPDATDIWDIEDAELISAAREWLKQRQGVASSPS